MMRIIIAALSMLFLCIGCAHADAPSSNPKGDAKDASHHDDGPRPFDPSREAMADVDLALALAHSRGVNALLVLGGNWCHDSRGLAAKFETPELTTLIAENYELVWVDVGRRDRNLDVAERFDVTRLVGTPTILIVSPEETLLNRDTVNDWRNADSRTLDEAIDYFSQWTTSGSE